MSTKSPVRIVILLVIILMSCIGVINGLSDNPPAFIENVHTIRQGPDSFAIYFSLRDVNMINTISDGKATIEIIQTPYLSYKGTLTMLFNQTHQVQKADFNKSAAGVMLYCFGPISNSQFAELNPNGANYAVVNIYFAAPSGKMLSAQCDLPIPL
jgi:hypothetical protein